MSARVRPDNIETLLQQMIAVDTVNDRPDGRPGREGALADYLEGVAGECGLAPRRLSIDGEPDNLLVWHEEHIDRPWLLFVSHMDTVATRGMTIDPFSGEIRDGRIYGRGSCDTKGSGAAALWSLMDYASGSDRPNNVAVLYTVDEEFGMTGAVAFVREHLPELARQPAGVIVGEPTGLRPVCAHNGVVRWKLETEGVAAHSSEPQTGKSAISMMAEVVRAVERDYIGKLSASHELTGRAQCSVNVIRGGSQVNIIPEHCEVEVDRRTVPGERGEDVLPAVERVLDEVRQANPDLVVRQTEPYIVPALDPSTNEAWSEHVCSVLRLLGLPDEATGAKYGTEASTFGQAGFPAVVLGPGDVAQAHTKDEWLDLNELRRGCEVYLAVMRTQV